MAQNSITMMQDCPDYPAASGDGARDVAQPDGDACQTGDRLGDLTDIIRAYNEVTQNLQRSHEALRLQVERLQQELASTDARLQRSKRLAALGEMAAGIAHEIRNPLAAIQLYAAMIIEDVDAIRSESAGDIAETGVAPTGDPRLAASLDNGRKIARAVRGLNGIVNDVLTFSRELKPRRRTVPVEELFHRALEHHAPAIAAAQIEVGVQVDVDLVIDVDRDLLHQAVLNLVRNAVDAMAPAGGTLFLRADRVGNHIVLCVRDTGPGIAEEDIDRIFNPFFTTRSTGTGLGLAIVHRILDAHGGTIRADNDRGAVFELYLPARTHDAHEEAIAGQSGVAKHE